TTVPTGTYVENSATPPRTAATTTQIASRTVTATALVYALRIRLKTRPAPSKVSAPKAPIATIPKASAPRSLYAATPVSVLSPAELASTSPRSANLQRSAASTTPTTN